MKLDRNINKDGTGKYALLLLRNIPKLDDAPKEAVLSAMSVLRSEGILDYGDHDETEFFVLRLRDQGAAVALHSYAKFFRRIDSEWADEVDALADKAYAHANRKLPD